MTAKDTPGVAIEEEAGLSAGAQVWPDPASDPGLFAARVPGMFAEFDRRVSAQEHALKAELREREQGDKELREALNREVNRLNKKAHGVATDGLRWEFAGPAAVPCAGALSRQRFPGSALRAREAICREP